MASSPYVELSIASRLARLASCSVAVCPVSHFCVCFTCFCFELAFSVNMKVIDNCVIFPVALVLNMMLFMIENYYMNVYVDEYDVVHD
ncbi:transmembrane protein, putative [Medicago truncatula]|uniref:Transmembrane protein, putative n=1 Tax=Medicago truncatula TaxID=3880 RepID=A0A072U391_MEDTR|nr:transmembrane protein, putative [Medicago truncatula]